MSIYIEYYGKIYLHDSSKTVLKYVCESSEQDNFDFKKFEKDLNEELFFIPQKVILPENKIEKKEVEEVTSCDDLDNEFIKELISES